MACLLYNTGRCLQLRMFNCPNFGVHFRTVPIFLQGIGAHIHTCSIFIGSGWQSSPAALCITQFNNKQNQVIMKQKKQFESQLNLRRVMMKKT